jgi:hypothetical protein
MIGTCGQVWVGAGGIPVFLGMLRVCAGAGFVDRGLAVAYNRPALEYVEENTWIV